ncbi:MAG: hypothetical protein HGGPFJEG_01291 [Ignavibacteria bacterium]|nr:hypothetical protein [Ignavibacteria bacterium]
MVLVKKIKRKLTQNKVVRRVSKEHRLRKFYKHGITGIENSKTILFWSTGGMLIQTSLEAVNACALKLRGHNVKMILCDGVFKACAKRVDNPEIEIKDWGKYCPGCIKKNSEIPEKLGIEYEFISNLINGEELQKLREISETVNFKNYKDFKYKDYCIGTHIASAMVRHTRGGSFEGLEELLKEYSTAVLVVTETSERALSKYKPDMVYMSHGIYADWGPACTVALEKKLPVVSYVCSYLNSHFYYGIIRNYKETFTGIRKSTWELFKDIGLTDVQKKRLKDFLQRRYMKKISGDMNGLIKDFRGDKDYFFKKYGLDKDKPVWGIMTHINWDAASDYFPMIYENFDDWLYDTVKTIYDINDVQWLIKIHPSEKVDNPETGCQKFIEKNFPDLPPHIKVVKMDDDISPEDFYSLLSGAVTVMGTGGLELSIKGKPVILAGEAHYSGKGFTYDAKDKEHYARMLRDAAKIEKPDEEKVNAAIRYAYIYFILRQIPLPPAIGENLKINMDKIKSILPGRDKFTDFLCNAIAEGKDMILPEELMDQTKVEQKDQIRQHV